MTKPYDTEAAKKLLKSRARDNVFFIEMAKTILADHEDDIDIALLSVRPQHRAAQRKYFEAAHYHRNKPVFVIG
jgi:hypothetical protein